jgi:hypothetical protein
MQTKTGGKPAASKTKEEEIIMKQDVVKKEVKEKVKAAPAPVKESSKVP